MAAETALETDVAELLQREPLTVTDCAELRREIYRADSSRSSFHQLLDEKYPADSREEAAVFRRGVGLAASGKADEARALLEKCDQPLAHYLLGRSALDRSDLDDAKKHLGEVSGAEHPAEYRMAYADVLFRLSDLEGLASMLEEMQKSDPRGADCAFVEGLLQEASGEYQAAVTSYERSVSLQPDHRSARFRLAYRLDLLGRDNEAIGHYERLKQVFPVSIGTLINLGVLYEDCEKYEKASSCFKLVLAHDASHDVGQKYKGDADASLEMFYDEEKERKDDKRAQILKIPVTDFELSVRSRNCLARMNIHSLGDLIRKTEAELLSFKNFGETSLNEIKEILRSKGLRLGMQPDDGDRRGGMGRRSRELDRDSVRSRMVADLDLSVRSRKALDNLNIMTVGQLTEISEEQLLSCKNFGQTSLVEIKKKLADLSLGLRGS